MSESHPERPEDVIRRALESADYHGSSAAFHEVLAALDVLLSERDRAVAALRRIGDDRDHLTGYRGAGDFARAELLDMAALAAADREPAETPETEWPEGGLPHGEHPHDYGYGPASAVSSEPAPRSTPIPCTTPHKMGEKPND